MNKSAECNPSGYSAAPVANHAGRPIGVRSADRHHQRPRCPAQSGAGALSVSPNWRVDNPTPVPRMWLKP